MTTPEPWTLTLFLDWEGGKRWGPRLKNQWRWCFTLEGGSYIQVQLQGGDDGTYLECDPEEFPLVQAYTWCSMKAGRNTYVATNMQQRRTKQFHTFVCPGLDAVDHIDRNGLNNRRANLRDGGGGVNQRNQRPYANNTSGVTGVNRPLKFAGWYATLGGHPTKTFADSKHGGREGAFRAACLWRARDCAECPNVIVSTQKPAAASFLNRTTTRPKALLGVSCDPAKAVRLKSRRDLSGRAHPNSSHAPRPPRRHPRERPPPQ